MISWNQLLKSELIKAFGPENGQTLSVKYDNAFPPAYLEHTIDVAINDAKCMETLSAATPLAIRFYYAPEKKYQFHLRFYQWQQPIPVSKILPILENLDVNALIIQTYQVTPHSGDSIWIDDIILADDKSIYEIEHLADIFQEAFSDIYNGVTENDGFNKLVLRASLSSREINLLRLYANYLQHAGFDHTSSSIQNALINNPKLTRTLVKYFKCKYDPSVKSKTRTNLAMVEDTFLQELVYVTTHNDEIIIRRLLNLIKATLRTNYFQLTDSNKSKKYISVKLHSQHIPDLPFPQPLYETYVYSAHFEGIHMRDDRVARGGIVFYHTPDGFRQKIIVRMKANNEKNATIIPAGAAGGIVVKPSSTATEKAVQEEYVSCYTQFISGLLDVTDNLVNKTYTHPVNVICYDQTDPYLLIDNEETSERYISIANELSEQYHFWLKDAFAAGGDDEATSQHIGIAAKGTWEAIKRLFLEKQQNVDNAELSVIGIGGFSDPAFYNGMQYSSHLKLVAAFDERHIFLDPIPAPALAHAERLRLIKLPGSTWENYDKSLISRGGGVFKRSLKAIPLSKEVRFVLGIEDNELSPNALIQAILRAPVDLLYVGMNGTFVKAAMESELSIMDLANEPCRVNGGELRCSVVGEGVSTGFTPLSRLEYTLSDGLINGGYIDNSAALQYSDYRVNLKILLDNEVRSGKLSESARETLLRSVSQEFCNLIVNDTYLQVLALSLENFYARRNINFHTDYFYELENKQVLNRDFEYLPEEKTLAKRQVEGIGLTRPELAILMIYATLDLKNEIYKSKLIIDEEFIEITNMKLPISVIKSYKKNINTHPLYHHILATNLSNQIIKDMGITFIYQMQKETGAAVEDILRAYMVVTQVFHTDEIKQLIYALDNKISIQYQYEMLYYINVLIGISIRWFLRRGHLEGRLSDIIKHYARSVQLLEPLVPELMGGITKKYLKAIKTEFSKSGLPNEVAHRVATFRAIYTTLNIIAVATTHHFDLITTAKVYFAAGEQMNLLWFRDQIANDFGQGHWDVMARLTLRDTLDEAQCALTVSIMKTNVSERNPTMLLNQWMTENADKVAHWSKFLDRMHSNNHTDYSMFFIVIREFMRIMQTT